MLIQWFTSLIFEISIIILQTHDFGHTGRVTGIAHGYGLTVTSSIDHTIRVMEPCDTPSCLRTLTLHSHEVAGVSLSLSLLHTILVALYNTVDGA